MKKNNTTLPFPNLRLFMAIALIIFGYVFSAQANDGRPKSEDHMDDYRWMETDQRQTINWLNHISEQSDKIIRSLPWRNTLARRLNTFVNNGPTISNIDDAGDNRFYLRSTTEYPYQRLFVKNRDNPERVIVDPPVGYGINFFSPSNDGQYVAYGLSKNGFDDTEIKIIKVIDSTVLKDSIQKVRYPNVVWAADNQSFYYSKNDAEENVGRKACGIIYLHRVGEENNVVTFDWRRIDELKQKSCENVNLYASADSDYLLVYVSRSISGYGGYLFVAKKILTMKGAYIGEKSLT